MEDTVRDRAMDGAECRTGREAYATEAQLEGQMCDGWEARRRGTCFVPLLSSTMAGENTVLAGVEIKESSREDLTN